MCNNWKRKDKNQFILISLNILPLESAGIKFLAFIISIFRLSSINCALTVNIPILGSCMVCCSCHRSKWNWCISSLVSMPWSFNKYSTRFSVSEEYASLLSCLNDLIIIFRHSWRFEKKAGGRRFCKFMKKKNYLLSIKMFFFFNISHHHDAITYWHYKAVFVQTVTFVVMHM